MHARLELCCHGLTKSRIHRQFDDTMAALGIDEEMKKLAKETDALKFLG